MKELIIAAFLVSLTLTVALVLLLGAYALLKSGGDLATFGAVCIFVFTLTGLLTGLGFVYGIDKTGLGLR